MDIDEAISLDHCRVYAFHFPYRFDFWVMLIYQPLTTTARWKSFVDFRVLCRFSFVFYCLH